MDEQNEPLLQPLQSLLPIRELDPSLILAMDDLDLGSEDSMRGRARGGSIDSLGSSSSGLHSSHSSESGCSCLDYCECGMESDEDVEMC